jgi:drug/metabolite transporter (DMT)-like permease
MSSASLSNRQLAYLALAAICLIWGTTYTAIKYAILYFPPYLLVGIRQVSAGLLLLTLVKVTGKWRQSQAALSPHYLSTQALIGVVTITGGNGFITWGMQYVSSGLAAVIGSLTPIVVLLIQFSWHRRGERLNGFTLSGVLVGFAGLGLIFNHGWADFLNPDYRWGILGCFASCFTWSMGTVMAKRFNSSAVSPMVNASIQVTAGGVGGLLLSWMLDTTTHIQHHWQGWTALLYLILIGSALAFSLYMFVLKQLSATAASLYTYINPVVAVLLGWWVLSEPLHWLEAIGMGGTLLGVWLVNRGESSTA